MALKANAAAQGREGCAVERFGALDVGDAEGHVVKHGRLLWEVVRIVHTKTVCIQFYSTRALAPAGAALPSGDAGLVASLRLGLVKAACRRGRAWHRSVSSGPRQWVKPMLAWQSSAWPADSAARCAGHGQCHIGGGVGQRDQKLLAAIASGSGRHGAARRACIRQSGPTPGRRAGGRGCRSWFEVVKVDHHHGERLFVAHAALMLVCAKTRMARG